MTNEQKAEAKILSAASGQAQPTAKLIDGVRRSNPSLTDDTVRYAYWTLVNEGKLERTPTGVRKVRG